MYKILVSPNNDSFSSFFLIYMLFISLYCLTALVRISSTMFKKNGQSFLPLNKLLALVLSYMGFIMLRYALSIPNLLMVILFCFTVKKKKKNILLNCFSASVEMIKEKVLVTQLCPTLCDPMDCSPPGSTVHGIFQARIMEWVTIPFSGGSSPPGIKPMFPILQADSLPFELPRKLK